MLSPGQSPFPKKTECKQCLTKPCHHLFIGRAFPGKVIFVHHSEFAALTTHRPDFRMKKDDDASAAALTDDIVMAPKEKVTITNPRWEHVDEGRKGSSPDVASIGDTIKLIADVTGIPEGSLVTFDIFDVTTTPPFRIATAKGKNEQGKGSGEWTVEDPNDKGKELRLEFEGIAKSKASERAEIKVKLSLIIAYQIDVDAESAKDDIITLVADDDSWKYEIKVSDLKEYDQDWVKLVFPGVPEGKTFNLIQDPGAEGEPFSIWQGASYDELFKGEGEVNENA